MRALKRITAAVVMTFACAAVASASEWTDRTKLKFTEPVMVPGATLAPGTYTFKLADSDTNRHLVQIFNEDETKLMATAQAIPTKRMDPEGDVVVTLKPTEAGAPIAIQSWFYPGSLYGHEFIYSDEQAKSIAQRSKKLVLSSDIAGEEMKGGKLYIYDAEGNRADRQDDRQTAQEWDRWRQESQRSAQAQPRTDAPSAKIAAPGTEETRESTAPMVRSTPKGMDVEIGDLDENPEKYTGQTINVTAEVETVFGPRLFKIDEKGWVDFDGEVLVQVTSPFAALIREDDQVTVTGTLKMVQTAELERELGWLEWDPDVEMEFANRPVLVASRIVGGDSDVALMIDASRAPSSEGGAVGTAGTTGTAGTAGTAGERQAAVTDATSVARGGRNMVGRQVDLDNVKVHRMQGQHGFWIQAGDASVFVLPASHATGTPQASAGQSVSIDGLVLEMPRSLRNRAPESGNPNDAIYIYATTVK